MSIDQSTISLQAECEAISRQPVRTQQVGRNWLAVTSSGSRVIGAAGHSQFEALSKLRTALQVSAA